MKNQAEVNQIEPLIDQKARLEAKARKTTLLLGYGQRCFERDWEFNISKWSPDHHKSRKKPPTQDVRFAQRLKRRYRVERSVQQPPLDCL